MEKDYQFFMKASMNNFIGQWVAICNSKIVSHGKDVKVVFKEAKQKCPKSRPLLTKIPDKENMIF